MTKGSYTFLSDRAAIAVSGPDARGFLQGMVTQDIATLDHAPMAYSLLLTAQGKVHYDFFMYNHGNDIILECEKNKAEDLLSRLRMFTLRKDVTLKIMEIQVIAVWNCGDDPDLFSFAHDLRHAALGYRRFFAQGVEIPAFTGYERVDEKFYHELLIAHTVPNGSRDIDWESDTVAELNLDRLNAVSFTKGCYLGQELTSRMHHRGLSKRGLYTVIITGDALRPFSDILADGNLIGEMRSSANGSGLAILRHDSLELLGTCGLKIRDGI